MACRRENLQKDDGPPRENNLNESGRFHLRDHAAPLQVT